MPATVSREFESNSVSPLDSYEKALYDAATAAQAREPPGIQELHNESEWRSLYRFDQRIVDLLIELFRHRRHSFVAMCAIDQQAEQFRRL